ncbi:hypothetical protein LTR37_006130 [Vermiconidia calcicola]|uniref:Uncharacterized protein n=1 Tax=Vermiconidia calcicola TaxID=1690605 RepID=A0ACC3NHG3_9PEZI|nr:hypothetical protein LTR37_006130 [Vermiconidia calcicola]
MESRVAIVTGASSGMGEALSRELVRLGWQVAMADIQENKRLSDELGSKAKFYNTNVADYNSQAKTFDQVFKDYNRLDALCANAGIVDRGSPYILGHRNSDEIPPAPDLLCTDVDWKGVVYGTQLAVHFMRKNKKPGGAIVATASIAAVHPHPTYPEYNGAKAAVLNWVRGTAQILKMKDHVRINCVMPGIVQTNIIPPEMVAAVKPEFLTPIKTIMDAYVKLLDDQSLVGQAIEGSVDKHFFFTDPPFMNGDATKRAITVWDPLFELNHGEMSGLPDAIPGKSFPKT